MAGQWQESSHENYFPESSQGHTQELNKDQKKGDERSECALVSDVSGWGQGGHRCRKNRRAVHSAGEPHTPAPMSVTVYK